MDYDLSEAIDLHIHTQPDIQPRLLDDIQAAEAAKLAGMRGILIKSHVVLTADRAKIAEKVVGGIRVFGGLVLNHAVGGFNLDAVEAAILMGAKVIWMPTHSAQSMSRWTGTEGGLSIFDNERAILSVVHEILDRIHQANIALATGHLSVEESVALVRLAKSMRLQKIIITHPESVLIRMPLEIQQDLNGPGVFFERCFVDTTPLMNFGTSIEEIGSHIRATGLDSTFLSTDFGQPVNPSPVEGMSTYLASLKAIGFTEREISKMACLTPAFLMDL
jgi:Family of unknown function (DUF6282)